MNFLEFYHKRIIQYDSINKFNFKNVKELPKLKKITLSFKTKNNKPKTFAATLFTLELIVTKSCMYTVLKKPNLSLKLQKGQPVGGKITLKKTHMFNFLSLLITEIFSKTTKFTQFSLNNHKRIFSFQINHHNLIFTNLKEHYNLYDLIPYINVTIVTNSKNQDELFFLMKSFQFKIKKFNFLQIYV